jgi:glycosyltransferase involved in cell wall biosynthesis
MPEVLVSIVVPNYNYGRWLGETLDSCLSQTHRPIEIIVCDDGSTDDSRAVIDRYLRQCPDIVRALPAPHRNANFARNRGIEAARGEFVQLLDSDDLMLPEKLTRQVARLTEERGDVCYADWRMRTHGKDGSYRDGEVEVSGAQASPLLSVLGGWWSATAAFLWRRDLLERLGRCDETLDSAQDTDIVLRAALSEARFVYDPSCLAIYRRHSVRSTSQVDPLGRHVNNMKIFQAAEARLRAEGRLAPTYAAALATTYFRQARTVFWLDRAKYRDALAATLRLSPRYRPSETQLFNLASSFVGFTGAELLAGGWRTLRRLGGRRSDR